MKRNLHPLDDPSKAPLEPEDDTEVVYLFVPPIPPAPMQEETADARGCMRIWIGTVLLLGTVIALIIGLLLLGVGDLLSNSANATLGVVLIIISLILQNLAERIRNHSPAVQVVDAGTNDKLL